MPFKCVVPGCQSNYYHVAGSPSVQMIKFPTCPDILAKWLQAISRPEFVPSNHSHVCIKHFAPEDLCVSLGNPSRRPHQPGDARKNVRFRIRYGAVPTVFEVDPSTHVRNSRLKVGGKTPPPAVCEIISPSNLENKMVLCSLHFEDPAFTNASRKRLLPHNHKYAIPIPCFENEGPIHSTLSTGDEVDSTKATHSFKQTKDTCNLVEFKPEMWVDGSISASDTEPAIKRPRGRPKKYQPVYNVYASAKVNKSANVTSDTIAEAMPCCALACPNTSETHTMTGLPEDPAMRNLWIKKIDRLAWSPEADSALCEIHFEPDMWDCSDKGKKVLKPDATPTLLLHGEAIQSWVTLDNDGIVKKIALKNHMEPPATVEKKETEKSRGDEINREENEENMKKENGPEVEADEDVKMIEEQMEEEEQEVFVKHEALEPEIAMVEGSEEIRDTSPERNHFETIFCDSLPILKEENIRVDSQELDIGSVSMNDLENPLSPESILVDDHSDCSQSLSSDKDEDTLKMNISNVKSLENNVNKGNNFYVISRPGSMKSWRIRRRSSSQLTDEFQCPICERRLSRRKNLELHMAKLHPAALPPDPETSKNVTEKGKEDVERKHSVFHVLTQPPTSSSAPLVQPTAGPLVTPNSRDEGCSPISVVTPPKDTSPTSGEIKKQILLLVQKPLQATPPPTPKVPESHSFSVNLASIPPEKRLALRIKLKELVDAVIYKNLNPERIIIAYDRT